MLAPFNKVKIMVYCMADIHGDYEKYRRMLETISLRREDTLYILGDVVDRGPEPIPILLDMMRRPNIRPILGNHEYMAVLCLRALAKEITEQTIAALSAENIKDLFDWRQEGGLPTLESFRRLDVTQRKKVLEYLLEFELYEEVTVKGIRYLLAHAGPKNFSEDRPLWGYGLHEWIWTRLDYTKRYYKDRFLVTGHTPVTCIPRNTQKDSIFRANGHIAIDCGCGFGGALGAICLDTGETFYVR